MQQGVCVCVGGESYTVRGELGDSPCNFILQFWQMKKVWPVQGAPTRQFAHGLAA